LNQNLLEISKFTEKLQISTTSPKSKIRAGFDFTTGSEEEISKMSSGEKEAREVLARQKQIMKDQDETLDSISETMDRLKNIG
jgi:hypothetical protein